MGDASATSASFPRRNSADAIDFVACLALGARWSMRFRSTPFPGPSAASASRFQAPIQPFLQRRPRQQHLPRALNERRPLERRELHARRWHRRRLPQRQQPVMEWQHRSRETSCKSMSRRPDPPPPTTSPRGSLRAAGSNTPASCCAATAFMSPNVGRSHPSNRTHVWCC